MSTVFDPSIFDTANFPSFSCPINQNIHQWSDEERRNSAAVCLLFVPPFEKGGDLQIILTKRSTQVRSHKGQISLPGGKSDPSDQGPLDTALRETEEEIGIRKNRVHFHGLLEPQQSIDGTLIWPIIASTETSPQGMKMNPTEVAEIISVPWSLLTATHARMFEFNMFGVWKQSYLYKIYNHTVWGITAKIISNCGFH